MQIAFRAKCHLQFMFYVNIGALKYVGMAVTKIGSMYLKQAMYK